MFSSSPNLNCCLQSATFATLNCDQCFIPRSLLMFTMENCFYVLVSQAVRYLKDPTIVPRDKQRLKQELSSELVRHHSSPDWTLVCAKFSFTLQMNLTLVLSSVPRAPFCPACLATSAGVHPRHQLAASFPLPSPSPPHQARRQSMKVKSLLSSSFRPLSGLCKDRCTFQRTGDSEQFDKARWSER